MHPAVGATGQIPDQPGVDGAEGDLPALGTGPQPRHLSQQPGCLRPGEVAGQRQSGGLPEAVLAVRAAQLRAQLRRTGVLPDDRMVHRPAGGPVPQDRGLPLVGDAQRTELIRAQPRLRERARHHRLHLRPDLGCVMLHPARLGEDLPVLTLVDGDDRPAVVEDDAAARRGALIDRGYVLLGLPVLPASLRHAVTPPEVLVSGCSGARGGSGGHAPVARPGRVRTPRCGPARTAPRRSAGLPPGSRSNSIPKNPCWGSAAGRAPGADRGHGPG